MRDWVAWVGVGQQNFIISLFNGSQRDRTPRPVELRVHSSLSVVSWNSLLEEMPPCSTSLPSRMGPMTMALCFKKVFLQDSQCARYRIDWEGVWLDAEKAALTMCSFSAESKADSLSR